MFPPFVDQAKEAGELTSIRRNGKRFNHFFNLSDSVALIVSRVN